jgi:hypothetical protein
MKVKKSILEMLESMFAKNVVEVYAIFITTPLCLSARTAKIN